MASDGEAEADPRPLRVAVIVGSTREGRVGARLGAWVTRSVAARGTFAADPIDLVDNAFPARFPQHPTPAMADFAARIADAEAFVVVTPEYNRSFPASLKQAIDYAYDEWHAKPVGFVSYGYRSRGLLAVEHLRQVFGELHTVTMRDTVGVDLTVGLDRQIGRPGDASGSPGELEPAVDVLLDRLAWWGRALRDARAARPYAA
ncbi:NAD(P)H-dependent oxidoreductase [Yinghuangia sp. ASG 101]|uniref:NADPH-dependent FMN reductase n=1 Tax=Yinghuangia sp. ASG 101 TaxID=2896848 RepID=UPI001E44111C|nr:NAD(P)H-dependent oxidoreductase [Yinghuangia sp. ASG 101]UGQ10774.1 NAD(P)H-dependent oxidoreductase [Yinghuangia sp. ASG 101]